MKTAKDRILALLQRDKNELFTKKDICNEINTGKYKNRKASEVSVRVSLNQLIKEGKVDILSSKVIDVDGTYRYYGNKELIDKVKEHPEKFSFTPHD